LHAIAAVLQAVGSDTKIGGDPIYLNALRGQAQDVENVVQGFVEKIKKYERSLGAGASRRLYHAPITKAQWAIVVPKEVSKLREDIDNSLSSIQLLFNLNSRYVGY
jgi:hypothetical protein